jgi:hypothetical protein
MATADQIKLRVDKFKTVAQVDTEIEKFTRQQSLAGNYNKPDSQAYVAALKIRKQQLSEQPAPRVPNYTPGGNAKRGGVGVADDNKANPPIPKKKRKTNSGPHPRNSTAPAIATPTTQAGEVGTLAAKFGKPKPGKRLQNPLSNFSSYTYQISLYMITPDAYNAFIQSGRTNINALNNMAVGRQETTREQPSVDLSRPRSADGTTNIGPSLNNTNIPRARSADGTTTIGPSPELSNSSPPALTSAQPLTRGGAYLIAQSGGINNNTEQRAPGFDTDFHIEDLKIEHLVTPSETQAAATVTDIQFKIIEPYGFSFIARLRKAQIELQSRTSALGYDKIMNATRNTFILGIKFLGYDENGELIDQNKYSSTLGNPVGNAFGIYERFLDIQIKEMKFKLDGKAVTYSISAAEYGIAAAFGVKRGIIEHTATVSGATVREALMGGSGSGDNGLISKLNKDQQVLKDKGAIQIAAKWDVKFQGDGEKIASASLISSADLDKRFWPQSNVKNTSESTVAKATNTKASPQNTIRKIILTGGTPILQAINEIIKQSSYLENALLAVTKSQTEPDKTATLSESEINNPSPTVIEWFNIRPEVENLGWDNKQKDFVFKTTYYIQTYSTPYTLSAYAGLTTPYYGPDKRYDYWFTGKNSELLKLDVAFDNNFYITTLLGSPDFDADKVGLNDIPAIAGKQQNQPKQGYLNLGSASPNSYMASLFDIKAWATSKLTILGDPDFLMAGVSSNLSELDDKFYGTDGNTINPKGRQVFVEVNLNEPEDYDNESGLLTMNKSIYFMDYPKIIKQDLDKRGGGIILHVTKATSTFNKGKFEQVLDCVLPVFYEKAVDEKADKDAQRPAAAKPVAANSRVNEQANARIKRQGAPTNSINVNAQANARILRQGAPTTNTNSINVNAQANARILRQGAQTPIVRPKENQTVTIPTKKGERVADDNAGINPRQRR